MTTEAKAQQVKKHHWLVTAQLLFVPVDKNKNHKGDPGTMLLNALVLTDKKELHYQDLARANTQCIHNAQHRFQGQPVQILDSVFMNIVHMGYMAQEDYEAQAATQALMAANLPMEEAPVPSKEA